MLMADLSSLVIRPPRIGLRWTLLNQRLFWSVKMEESQRQFNMDLHGFFKLTRVPARSVGALAASASMSLMASLRFNIFAK
jgi:hypothetical protein